MRIHPVSLKVAVILLAWHVTLYAQQGTPDSEDRVPQLIIQLEHDSNRRVRERAAMTLGESNDPRAVEPLLAAARSDSDRRVRERASGALEKIVKALGESRERDAVLPLLSVLAWERERTLATSALWRIIPTLENSDDPEAVQLLTAILDRSANASTLAGRVVEALQKTGDATAVEPLIRTLKHPGNLVRAKAASALGALRDTRAVEPLILALSDPWQDVQVEAARALGVMEDTRAVEALLVALQNPNHQVRGVVAWALGMIGDSQATESLIAALRDPAFGVRVSSAAALGKIGDERAVEPLMYALQATLGRPHELPPGLAGLAARMYQSQRWSSFQEEAIGALSAIGASAVDHLVAALQNELMVGAAAEALGEISDSRAADALIAGLREGHVAILYGAYRFFIRVGEPGSESLMAQALDLHGDMDMAHDFLRSGNPTLEQAARSWNEQHGVLFVTRLGVPPSPRWGEGRQ